MSKYKVILLYVLFIFFFGCKVKEKSIEKVSEIRSDTIYSKIETITRPPILSSLTINEICDSITGIPKDFNQVFIVGQDTLELSIENNQLKFKVNQLEKTLKQIDSINRISKSEINTSIEKDTTKEVYPLWLIISIPLLILLFLFKERIPLINLIKL